MANLVLNEALQSHFDGAPSIYASAVRADGQPLVTRVLGAWPNPGEDRLTFCVSAPYSTDFLAGCAAGARMSVVVVQVATYLTFQFKGAVISATLADAAAVAQTEERLARFGALVAHVGIDASRYHQTYTAGPFMRIEMSVESVFDQTPRLGAGNLVRAAEVRP